MTALILIAPLIACAPATENVSSRPDYQAFLDCGVTEAENARLMSLSLDEFDEYSDDGWTTIASKKDCNHVAAQIILNYIEQNNIGSENYSQFLYFNAGQLYALSGDYEIAKSYMLKSNTTLAPGQETNLWREYVISNIAFLERDKKTLEKAQIAGLELISLDEYQDELILNQIFVEENPQIDFPRGFPEKPVWLIEMESLLYCFEKSYKEALSKQCNPN